MADQAIGDARRSQGRTGLFGTGHVRPRTREAIGFYLCIMPWIIGFLVFTLGPMLYSRPYNMAPTMTGLLLDGQAPRLDPRADQIRRTTMAELDPVWLGEKTIAEVAPIIDEKVNEILTSEELPELS